MSAPNLILLYVNDPLASTPVSKILAALDQTVTESGVGSGVGTAGIDLVCCAGGTAKVNAIHEGIASRFPVEKIVRLRSLHAVAQGLAERAKRYL